MVFFNYTTMQMTAKIVYYGPGLCGKTTNLHAIHQKTAPTSRGEMVSLETETDRTLFFDLLPLDVGVIGGLKVRLQLYTVPGQVFYNATRKLVLKGVDGVVFVADSQIAALEANLESFQNLQTNLAEINLTMDDVPVVLQYNKRDIRNIHPVEKMNEVLNPEGKQPFFEAAALHGIGVFETLKGITKATINSVRKKMSAGAPAPVPKKPAPAAEAAPAPAAATAPPPAAAAPAAPPAAAPAPAKAEEKVAAKHPPAKHAPAAKAEAAPPPAPVVEAPKPPEPPKPAPTPEKAPEPAEEVAVEFAEVGSDRSVRAVKTKGQFDVANELAKLRTIAGKSTGAKTPVATASAPVPKAIDKRLQDLLVPDHGAKVEVKRKAHVEVGGRLLKTAPTVRVHLVFDTDGEEKVVSDVVTVDLGPNKRLEHLTLHLDLDVKGNK